MPAAGGGTGIPAGAPGSTGRNAGATKALLPLLAAVAFLATLGTRDLTSSHEARAAQNAQRMLDTGDWGLPALFDGRADLQKPPGYYWAAAAAGWAGGGAVTEWAVRLPAALAGLLCVLLVFAFLRADGRSTAAWVAAAVLATATHFIAISRTARVDVPLACAVLVSLIAFYRGCRAGRTRSVSDGVSLHPVADAPGSPRNPLGWHLLSAVAAAIAVLLKGPVALALIGPAAVAWLVVERRHTAVRLPLTSAALGPLVVAAVALPWFVWANAATGGEFGRVFFWHHTVARYTGSSPLLASHPAWYYLPRFAIDFLPWTPALALLGWWAVRSGWWRADPAFRFGLVAAVAMVAVLSTARFKRADYLLPAYPFAAVALGCAAEAWLATRTARTARRATWGAGLTLAAVAAGWVVAVAAVEPGRDGKRGFAAAVREYAPAPAEVLQFRMESHLLSYHLGPPVRTLIEWGELNDRLSAPGPHVVVMPPEYVVAAARIVTSRRLVEVSRQADPGGDRFRSLVFLRTAD
jgi:4-amino-4-deoxy-L-arabinose transferase-like glycosyltransferase